MPTTERYAILKLPPAFPPPKPGVRAMRVPGAPPSKGPTLTFESLDEDGRRKLRGSPDWGGAAPVRFPMRLIRPAKAGVPATPTAGAVEWGIRAVGADKSHPYSGKGVAIAILDTGIDSAHPAFEGVNLIRKNFTNEEDSDTDGHGTHCAGTILGRDVHGQRIGVARGVEKAFIGKVIGAHGGSLEGILGGIDWAVQEGADIISMSLGIDFPGYQEALQQSGLPAAIATSRALVDYLATVELFESLHEYVSRRASLAGRSVLVIAAAGNESLRDQNLAWRVAASPPANARGLVAVGALAGPGPLFSVAPFSNTGPALAAPGVDIVSAWPGGGVMSLSGTSMATPHVAGVAALWIEKMLSQNGRIDADQLKARLIGQSQNLPDISSDDAGIGLVRAPTA